MAHHKNGGGGGAVVVAADPYAAYAAGRALPPPPPGYHQYPVPLNMIQSSESDDMDGARGPFSGGGGSSSSKKRFRTKFTAEQKARMLDFAEHVGWRLQKLDDGMVQAFCQEIGVKRRVLKVWMHNNKHNLATKRLEAPPPQMPIMAVPPPVPVPVPVPVLAPPPPQQQQPRASSCHSAPGSPASLKLQ